MKKLSKKESKKNKTRLIILSITILILIIIGTTVAYFGWSSSDIDEDSIVDVSVSSGSGVCEKASDNDKLLVPTSSRNNGRIIKINAKQLMATNATITWNLVVNRINTTTTTTTGLKHNSFKYELINNTTGVSYGSGNFANITNGSTITFSSTLETIDYDTNYEFILYLWIDGTLGDNPLDMADQTFDFDINCNITGTDTKLGA